MPGLGEDLVTISDAKVRLHELLRGLGERNVLLLKYGRPVAALLSYKRFTRLLDRLEELEDRVALLESARKPDDMMVDWNKVKAEAGLLGEEP
jgi:PHD/YefM family antitoxin component YafN of YafNO toxin-antitoxin module